MVIISRITCLFLILVSKLDCHLENFPQSIMAFDRKRIKNVTLLNPITRVDVKNLQSGSNNMCWLLSVINKAAQPIRESQETRENSAVASGVISSCSGAEPTRLRSDWLRAGSLQG